MAIPVSVKSYEYIANSQTVKLDGRPFLSDCRVLDKACARVRWWTIEAGRCTTILRLTIDRPDADLLDALSGIIRSGNVVLVNIDTQSINGQFHLANYSYENSGSVSVEMVASPQQAKQAVGANTTQGRPRTGRKPTPRRPSRRLSLIHI